QDVADANHADSFIPDDVKNDYATRTWPGTSTLLATVPLQGQRLAFAVPHAPDDTTFAVRTFTFAAQLPEPTTFDNMTKREARYVPVMRRAEIDVPALQQIAQTSDAATVIFAQRYLSYEFSGDDSQQNPGQVFLAADPDAQALGVKFSARADRSGGLV